MIILNLIPSFKSAMLFIYIFPEVNSYGINMREDELCALSSSFEYEIHADTRVEDNESWTLKAADSLSSSYNRMRCLSRQDAMEGSLVSLNNSSPTPSDIHTSSLIEPLSDLPITYRDGSCDCKSVPNIFTSFSHINTKAMKLPHRSHPSLFHSDSSDTQSVGATRDGNLRPFLTDTMGDEQRFKCKLSLISYQSSDNSSSSVDRHLGPPSYLEAEELPALCSLEVTHDSLNSVCGPSDWADTDSLCHLKNGQDNNEDISASSSYQHQSTCDSCGSTDTIELISSSGINPENSRMVVCPSDLCPEMTVISTTSGASEMKIRPNLPQQPISIHVDSFEEHADHV